MRQITRLVMVGLVAVLVNALVPAPPASAAGGGPLVLMGIDAEDGGPGGHGPVTVYEDVINNGILGNVTNGGSGILVLGGGKSPTDDVTRFWNDVALQTAPVTYANGAAVGTQSFAGFKMLAVVSDILNTPGGGLTQAENNALAARQSDVATFVNTGGGLLGFSSDFTNPYAYLAGVGSFTVNTNLGYSNITPTPAGTAVGITNALDVSAWHDEYVTFPAFLGVLATNAATGRAAAIGGANVIVPTNVTLTPPSATNPVGSPHTVTATVLDNNNNPLPGTLVNFSVTGANAGATGTCTPPSCRTDAAGQVSFTYTGTNVGNDTITACFTNQAGSMVCTTASKTWFSPVTISINDVTANEGDGPGLTDFTFDVTLSQAAPAGGVTVLASTANATASAPGDFVAQTNTPVVFSAGQTARPFIVKVVGDLVDEPTETFAVILSSPTNAAIADGHGIGTIVDDERNGAFSCRASAVRLVAEEPVVANAPDSPCRDGANTAISALLNAGLVNLTSNTLNATTDQTPNDLETTAPAATDNGVANASVERATVKTLGLVNISATAVTAQAKVECVAGPTGGLVPKLTSSGTIGSLKINGISVNVNGAGIIQLPLGLGSVVLNGVKTTSSSITHQAIAIRLLGIDIVIAEAKADFTGNPCAQ